MLQFGPLWQHKDFMRLWTAQAMSAFGSRITRTALPIIAILAALENAGFRHPQIGPTFFALGLSDLFAGWRFI